MRFKTIMNIVVLGSLVLGFLATFAPVADAAGGTIAITPVSFSESIKPLRQASCQSSKVSLTADYSAYSGLIGIPVTYTVTAKPGWASVILSPSTDIFPNPTPGANNAGSFTSDAKTPLNICVTASQDAPAFVSDTIIISAAAQVQSGAASGTLNFPISADYFSIIDVALQEAVKVDRPQTPVTFPVTINNLGNANTKVTFTIDQNPNNLNIVPPQPTILQSKQGGGTKTQDTVQITVQTPYHNGYLNEVGTALFKVTSAYALDPKLVGDSSQLSIVLTTRGFYVPGFEPWLLVAAVGGVAALLAVRRRFA
jgi:hypothetical protein